MTPLDDALAEILAARRHAVVARELIVEHGVREDADDLGHVVGTLAGMAASWEIERDRWRR